MPTDESALTDVEAARLRELCAKATPGPWYTVDPPWRPPGVGTYVVAGHPDPHRGIPVLDSLDIDEWPADQDGPDYSQSDADLDFVCAARAALPRLLDEVRRLRALLADIGEGLP